MPELLTRMPRPLKQGLMLAVDILALMFAVWAAYALRLGEWFVPNQGQMILMLAAPVIALPIFLKTGL